MARFRSSSIGPLPLVADRDACVARITDVKLVTSDYDERGQLLLTLEMSDGAQTPVTDYVSLRTGAMPGGAVAKLRQLLCALSGRPESDEPWFDDETHEYGFGDVDTPAVGRLSVGADVQVRGIATGTKRDPASLVYRVETYEPVGGRRRGNTPPGAAPRPVTPQTTPTAPPAPAAAAPVPAAVPAPGSFDDF